MGLTIAVLKLTAVASVPIAIFGAWHLTDPTREEQRYRPNVVLWIVFGVAIWFGSKLINGRNVSYRRGGEQVVAIQSAAVACLAGATFARSRILY